MDHMPEVMSILRAAVNEDASTAIAYGELLASKLDTEGVKGQLAAKRIRRILSGDEGLPLHLLGGAKQ